MTSPYEPAGQGIMPPGGEITSDDKLWALLDYVLTPVVPIVIMLMEDKKGRPFLKAHTMQALAAGVVAWVLIAVLGAVSFGCLGGIAAIVCWVALIYWGLQAYNGKYVTIPFLTDFVKRQSWGQ
jgi:uncharacterized membrane protein